jgi:hypothetical protein
LTKKNYEAAARIVQEYAATLSNTAIEAMTSAFVELFADDSVRFDEARFRRACRPGANVSARAMRADEASEV